MGEPGIEGREGRERAEPPEPVFACPGAWAVCMAMLEWDRTDGHRRRRRQCGRHKPVTEHAAALGPDVYRALTCRAAVCHGSLPFVSKRTRECGGRLIGGGLQAAVRTLSLSREGGDRVG